MIGAAGLAACPSLGGPAPRRSSRHGGGTALPPVPAPWRRRGPPSRSSCRYRSRASRSLRTTGTATGRIRTGSPGTGRWSSRRASPGTPLGRACTSAETAASIMPPRRAQSGGARGHPPSHRPGPAPQRDVAGYADRHRSHLGPGRVAPPPGALSAAGPGAARTVTVPGPGGGCVWWWVGRRSGDTWAASERVASRRGIPGRDERETRCRSICRGSATHPRRGRG